MARPTNRRAAPNAVQTPPDPDVQQRAWAALVLGVLSPIGLALGVEANLHRSIYVVLLTLAIGFAAVLLGFSALRTARNGGTARPRGAVGGTTCGIIGMTFSVLALIAFAAFWPQLDQLSNCMAGANTVSAQQACQHQFSRSVDHKLGVIPSG